MKTAERVEALRHKRLATGVFDPGTVRGPADTAPSGHRRPRRLRHCDQVMRHLWQGIDYCCEQCGLVVEVYDDLMVDGYTGQPVLIDSSSFIGNLDPLGSGRTIPKHSMKEKAAMAAEAKASGIKPTARKHGISPSTLRNYVRQTAALWSACLL